MSAMAFQKSCDGLVSQPPFFTSSSTNKERHWRSMVYTPQHRESRLGSLEANTPPDFTSAFPFTMATWSTSTKASKIGRGRSIRFCIWRIATFYQLRQRFRKLSFSCGLIFAEVSAAAKPGYTSLIEIHFDSSSTLILANSMYLFGFIIKFWENMRMTHSTSGSNRCNLNLSDWNDLFKPVKSLKT